MASTLSWATFLAPPEVTTLLSIENSALSQAASAASTSSSIFFASPKSMRLLSL